MAASCFTCKHRFFRKGERPEESAQPHNAQEIYGQNMIAPNSDDNPAFLMRSTDGQVRRYHGQYNECTVFGYNLDKVAQREIDILLNSADFKMIKGTIYRYVEDYAGYLSPRNLYEPSDLVLAEYYANSQKLSDTHSRTMKKFTTLSAITNQSLQEQGNKCASYMDKDDQIVAKKEVVVVEVAGRQIKTIKRPERR